MKFSIKNFSVSVTFNGKCHFLCNDIENKEQGRYLKLLAKTQKTVLEKIFIPLYLENIYFLVQWVDWLVTKI